jgi:hypothetical protein
LMRYWTADETPSWSRRPTKTPKRIEAEWDAFRKGAEDRA